MARIRSVKPDLCESETMARLSAEAERTFVRLWTHLDDQGRAKDDARLVKAALFPLHDDVTPAVIEEHLRVLAAEGLLVRYTVDGKRYMACPSWHEHQHPQKPRPSKFPAPDDADPAPVPDASRTSRVHVPDGSGPVVVVGGVEVDVVGGVVTPAPAPEPSLALVPADGAPATPERASYPAEFEAWWEHYPRKVDKAQAAKAYKVARRTVSAEHLLDAVKAHAAAWLADGVDPAFIVYPERWLKRKRYDEPPERKTTTARPQGRAQRNQDAILTGLARAKGGTR